MDSYGITLSFFGPERKPLPRILTDLKGIAPVLFFFPICPKFFSLLGRILPTGASFAAACSRWIFFDHIQQILQTKQTVFPFIFLIFCVHFA